MAFISVADEASANVFPAEGNLVNLDVTEGTKGIQLTLTIIEAARIAQALLDAAEQAGKDK